MSINSSIFQAVLKLTDVTPVYKKDSRYQKATTSLSDAQPNLSKIFENTIYNQIAP